ncbi:CBS domain-containing protein [Poritiphilus flavus]|uniref:CBS domain-containing protein n=1 Tax=Poritiphilus flavus TaxID=2697053 RepID=A0A6L9E756_9FLAO|nr:CBS domain-containing protein [Poritiphilus flavus]NAS10422.1 CBS domain-containing protein [Poritiphilus flavus]
MKREIPISRIMTKEVVTLSAKDDLSTAESLFKSSKIRHIPVLSEGKIIGMLSYTDLLRISFADAVNVLVPEEDVESTVYNLFNVEQIMARNVESVTPQTSIYDVAAFLAKKEFHALPVVEGDELVGIVTTTDLINYLLAQYE